VRDNLIGGSGVVGGGGRIRGRERNWEEVNPGTLSTH